MNVCLSQTRSPTDSDRAQHVFLFCTRSVKHSETGGVPFVLISATNFNWVLRVLGGMTMLSGWWVMNSVCSHSFHRQSLQTLPFFPPGWLIKPTLEADFPHCQQMPAHICINTLHLKRQPDWNATMLQYPGNGKLGAGPINGSWILAHQKH